MEVAKEDESSEPDHAPVDLIGNHAPSLNEKRLPSASQPQADACADVAPEAIGVVTSVKRNRLERA